MQGDQQTKSGVEGVRLLSCWGDMSSGLDKGAMEVLESGP